MDDDGPEVEWNDELQADWDRERADIETAWFEANGVPPHLRDLCELRVDGIDPVVPLVVNLESPDQASSSELIALARTGFGLSILPRNVFDIAAIVEPLAWFTYIHGLTVVQSTAEIKERYPGDDDDVEDGQNPHPGGLCINLSSLDAAVRATSIFWQGAPLDDVDLSRLPALESISGNALINTAARNRHLRRVSEGFENIPSDFICTAPVEQVTIRVARSFRDLSCVVDTSALKELEIRGPASFDLSSLRDCQALETLEIIECRELLGVETLLGLPNLKQVSFESPRSMPGYEKLERLPFTFYFPNNYLFEAEQVARLSGVTAPARVGYVGRKKTAKRPKITEHTRVVLVEGSDVTSFPPFEINSVDEGGYELLFDDWAGLSDTLLGDDGDDEELAAEVAEQLAERILTKDAPDLMQSGRLEFDSETDFMRIAADSLDDIERLARTLALVWANKRRMRSSARGLL